MFYRKVKSPSPQVRKHLRIIENKEREPLKNNLEMSSLSPLTQNYLPIE